MPKDNLTPEEQLLKIIENPDDPNARKPSGLRLPSFSQMKGLFSSFKNESKKMLSTKATVKEAFSLKTANRVLVGAAALLAILLVMNLAFFRPNPEKTFALGGDEWVATMVVPNAAGQEKPASFYKEVTDRRNIFGPIEPKPVETAGEAAPAPAAETGTKERQIDVLTQGLKLVGISWGADPQAMIEDTKTGRTYFVRPGQVVMEKVQVRGVFRDRVVLNYDDQEKELF